MVWRDIVFNLYHSGRDLSPPIEIGDKIAIIIDSTMALYFVGLQVMNFNLNLQAPFVQSWSCH
jgi:hypothetical protein